MSVAKKCDCCGKLYEAYNHECQCADQPNGLQFLNIRLDGENAYDHNFIDCCPDCMTSIQQHIKNLGEQKNG